ncbi:MAG: SUMF1/EgtB/PvdO family nonheme iron enzyme [Bacteroidia bacterium]|nr:SUMF1/EgtB/PvdO family nonheme iron enzyme [Bacteroidia bacterium]
MLLKISPPKSINFSINNFTLEMIEVPGGSFRMDKNYKVTLSHYLIGKYPVTQELWLALMPENPSEFKGNNRPVENVSWFDAVRFCNALSKSQGLEEVYTFKGKEEVVANHKAKGFRLPTEAQWEYAARGGAHHTDNYEYAGGNDLHPLGWYKENSHNQTQPVGLKIPNQLGIYDMTGNVWEWCGDRYDNYPSGEQVDPVGPDTGSIRMYRGGSWIASSRFCRVAFRHYYSPEIRDTYLGFRLVFAPPV